MAGPEPNLDQLLKARAEIEAALRRHKAAVTVLFTDVVGSTAYFDRYGDTAGVVLLHRHAELASAAVEEFRGAVIKTLGDSVMAVFPGPTHAVRAAVEIQRRLVRLNETLAARERLQLRVGVHHGPAFQSAGDVFGDAVNVAARITKRAGPAQILISRSVREAITLESDLRCSWLARVTIEGKAEKEDVFEVLWTDRAEYEDVRTNLTNSLLRGELTAPGLRADELIGRESKPEALPDENATLGAALSVPPPATLAERFEILAELGRGGMGVVYQARDRETGAVVALKALKPEIASRPDLIERFKNELLLARKITHKNVCRTYDLHRFGDTTTITMEFVEGESLRCVLKRVEGVSLRQGLRIARQILAGMAEAHAQGVVHRDLKPENIMIAGDGTVKIMDFGIARAAEGGATTTGSLVGTPAYMSPEQAEGKPSDNRTDIYALGLIFYEMFTGEAAFRAETPIALVHKQIHETPPPPSQATPVFPIHLERIILRCLEKNPSNRFQTVLELDEALATPGKVLPGTRAVPEPEVLPALEPPPHLLVWSRSDWVLLTLALLGLVYFLSFRGVVLPASNWILKVDALAARRQAEEAARRVGHPFPGNAAARLEFREDIYIYETERASGRRTIGPWRTIWPFRMPVFWHVRFYGLQDGLLSAMGTAPERLVVMDQNGEILRFHHTTAQREDPPNFKAPPVDQRREAARQAAVQVCGSLPEGLVLSDATGTAQSFFFTASGRIKTNEGGMRSVRVDLAGSTPIKIDCASEVMLEPLDPQTRWLHFAGAFPRIVRWLPTTVVAALSVGLLILFFNRRSYRLPDAWKRNPMAALLGVAGTWLFLLRQPALSEALVFFLILAGSGLIWIGLVTAEHTLRQREPGIIASYVTLWQGRLNHPGVRLAILRGSLMGLAYVGVETLLAHGSLSLLRRFELPEIARVLVAFVLTPGSIAQAAESSWPWLYVSCWALIAGVIGSLVFLGLPWAHSLWLARIQVRARERFEWEKKLDRLVGFRRGKNPERQKKSDRLVLPVVAFLLTLGLVSPLLQYSGLYRIVGLYGVSILFAWLVTRYDVLTVGVTLATIIIWSLNYPLLVIFSEVGNGGHWAVFVVWGAITLLAGVLAALPNIKRRYERLAT